MSMNSQHHLDVMFSLIKPVVEASGHQLYDIQHNAGTLAVLVDGCLLYTSPSPRDRG